MVIPSYKTHVTGQYTNVSQTITGNESFLQLSIMNDSASTGNVSVRGKSGYTIGGLPETAIELKAGQIINIGDEDSNKCIDDFTITTPATATVKIVGIRKVVNNQTS